MSAIYKIGDIGSIRTGNGRGMLAVTDDNIGEISEAELDLMVHKQRLELEQQIAVNKKGIGSTHDTAYEIELIAVNNALADMARERGSNDFKPLRIIKQGPAGHPQKRVPQVTPIVKPQLAGMYNSPEALEGDDAEIGLFKSKKQRLAKQLKRNEAGKGISKKWAKKMDKLNVVVNKKKAGFFKAIGKGIKAFATAPFKLITTSVLRVTLPKNAPFFLYLFLEDKTNPARTASVMAKIPDIVRQKREKAINARNACIKKLGMRPKTFDGIVRNGIMNRYGKAPEAVLAEWMQAAGFVAGIFSFLTGGGAQQAGEAAGQAAGGIADIFGLNFKDMQEYAPDPGDFGAISDEQRQKLGLQMQQFPEGQDAVQDMSTQQMIDQYGGGYGNSSYGGGYSSGGSSYGGGSSGGSSYGGSGWDNKGNDPDEATGDTKLNDVKELDDVEITAHKKSDMLPYLLLGGAALMVMSGKPKRGKRK